MGKDIMSATASTGGTTCPFFKAHSKREIQCESYTEFMKTGFVFQQQTMKEQYKATYCDGNHVMCPHFRSMMIQKYDENPDQYWRRKNKVGGE